IDLRLSVGDDLLDGHPGEAPHRGDLPEEPHPPPGADGEDGGDAGGEVPVVQGTLLERIHMRPPAAGRRGTGDSQSGGTAPRSVRSSASDDSANARSTAAMAASGRR